MQSPAQAGPVTLDGGGAWQSTVRAGCGGGDDALLQAAGAAMATSKATSGQWRARTPLR